MRCKHCKDKFEPKVFLQKFCLIKEECKDSAIKSALEKVSKDREKKEKKDWQDQKKEFIEKTKNLSEFKKDLEKEINTIVRLLDAGHECISGGFEWGKYKVHAGHLYSVGGSPSIRFNLLNIYGQSEHDNLHLHGNGAVYKERIRQVFGDDVANEVEELRIKYPELKAKIPEIKEAISKAKSIVKILKAQNETFTTEERINLRRVYNKMIGLYL